MKVRSMNKAVLPLAMALVLATPVAASARDVEVTRFHTPESIASAAPGPIAVRAGPGLAPGTLETQVWLDAVAGALARQGFTIVPGAPRVAEVSLEQVVVPNGRARGNSGVSVGVGVGSGGGGWYGRGGGLDLGVGLGFLLGGKGSRDVLDSTLAVTILDAGGTHAWEGRAASSVRVKSKEAEARPLATEMAQALFSGFPGESGATIGAK
jgi:hypothetical protein